MKQNVNIVWFKRDLRLSDHKPMQLCAENNLPIILLYIFEPSLINYGDSDIRHWRFAYQSLLNMRQTLQKNDSSINILFGEAENIFTELKDNYSIENIFSHQEIGNRISYDRDKKLKILFKQNNINWIETATNGISRGLKNRENFATHWHKVMYEPAFEVNLENLKTIVLEKNILSNYKNDILLTELETTNKTFQPGGENNAQAYLKSFLYERKTMYSKHISKPLLSRKSCSRISPYLAWGNISMKQVYQAAAISITVTGDKNNIKFFADRLHWHCHFIQKFESECRMEFENLNKGFDEIRQTVNEDYLTAWKTGTTGYPLVDACMNCVVATGYLNFRMRSMLVSFLSHHLWQPWQAGVHHLAKQFLDYEPGIHYPQFQMQAGTMGVNTIRTYNPVKQSTEHDPEGIFIKQWVAALQNVPSNLIHEPWAMTDIEQEMYNCIIGVDYPNPIVDLQTAARYAREHLWATKKSKKVATENVKVLATHVKKRKAKIVKTEKIKTVKTKTVQNLELNFN